MELWRTNCNYAVIQTLEQLNTKDKNHYLTDTYEAMLSQNTIRLLCEKFRFNLSLEEIIFNARILASFMLGKKSLSFGLKPIHVRPLFETEKLKQTILTKTARQLGMNKSSHWYQRKRLLEDNTVRLYNKSRQYFV